MINITTILQLVAVLAGLPQLTVRQAMAKNVRLSKRMKHLGGTCVNVRLCTKKVMFYGAQIAESD